MDALGSRLGYDEAARIVGNHFPEVKDKLLNTLQLQQQVDNAAGSDITLLAAASTNAPPRSGRCHSARLLTYGPRFRR